MVARSVAGVLRNHVDLEYEAIDRMYLNVYVPHLQTVGATVGYLRVKDNVTQAHLRKFKKNEGVLYVGNAHEKAQVMRAERRRCSRTGATYPWIVESTAMVNHYYFYCMDEKLWTALPEVSAPTSLKTPSSASTAMSISSDSSPSAGSYSSLSTTASSLAPIPTCCSA